MFDANLGINRDRLLDQAVGRRCTVFSRDNQFLFLGRVTGCTPGRSRLILEHYSGQEMEGWLVASTQLKLHIPLEKDNLLVVEGQVEQWSRENLVLEVITAIGKKEARAYFRQNVGREGHVEKVNGEPVSHRCIVVDVSATGVAITCRQDYQVGDTLELAPQRFRPGGAEHKLKCRVARVGPQQEDVRFYGCQWVELSPKAEERLFQEVFALQAAELHKQRER